MTEQSPNYLPQDTKPEALHPANVALPRYKIGYRSDEWGMGGNTPTGIPSPDGAWVRCEDAQAVATGYAAARLEIDSLQARLQEVGNAARENRSRAVVELEVQLAASNKSARDAEFASECYRKDIEALIAPLRAERYDLKDWREGSRLERIEWLIAMYESSKAEVARLEAQLDAVGAGGVEPLRRGKCLHQIVEPQPLQHDEDLLEQLYWDFDDTRNKTGDECMTFKRKMRFYAHRMSFMPQPNPVESHQIVEPQQVEPKPVAWRGGPAYGYLARYQYTDIGSQAETWKKQGLNVEPLYTFTPDVKELVEVFQPTPLPSLLERLPFGPTGELRRRKRLVVQRLPADDTEGGAT